MIIFLGVWAIIGFKLERTMQLLIRNKYFFNGLIFAKFKKKETMLLQIKIYLLFAYNDLFNPAEDKLAYVSAIRLSNFG